MKSFRLLRRMYPVALLAVGGCVTDLQLQGFFFQELARVIAGYAGLFFDTFLRATQTGG